MQSKNRPTMPLISVSRRRVIQNMSAAAAAASTGIGFPGVLRAEGEIKVGFISPISGFYAPQGNDMLHSAQMAIDAINKQAPRTESDSSEPAIRAWVFLPEKVSMRYIAHLAGEDVRRLCGRMHRLGIVCTIDRAVDFADAQRVLLTYGIQAEPTEPEQGCSSERVD